MARDIGLDSMADRLLAVAGDKQRDPNCRSVEVEALKWYLCKLAPKRYGDRLDARLVDGDGNDRPNKIIVQFEDAKGRPE